MSRILLDENIPVGLAALLPDHDVRHVSDLAWKGVSNGELIEAAEKAGYEALITADKNLSYQQNMAGRSLSLVVVASNNWKAVQQNVPAIEQALERMERGSYQEIEFEMTRGRGRGLR
jgi:predicted nuclease of predicted toxin-antitoxin system